MKKITTGALLVGLACLASAFGAGFALYLRPAQATRNSAGTYALPTPGVPFQSNQVISSTQVNNAFNDVSSTLTDSLDRNGKGGMLAALRGIDGTLAAPAFSYTSETGSGLFRNGAGDLRMAILGALRENWTSTGVAVTGTLGASGTTSLATGGTKLMVDGTTVASNAALYVGTNGDSPSSTNYSLAGSTTTTVINAPSNAISLAVAGTSKASVTTSGMVIGASGTAVSQSGRGTASLTPAAINAQQCQTQTITVAGATAGTECLAGIPSGGLGGLALTCNVTSATACTLYICNGTAGSVTPPTGTYTCRYFNP